MNLSTLNDFRHEMYNGFGNGKDALFNLVDALSSEAGARSFPELSFSPFFERTWASLYEALEDGQIDAERLREVFVDFAPLPQAGECVFLGIDTSNLYRPEAETASDRTLVPIANLPKNTHAASPGWVMSHVVLLPTQAGQGTYVLDTARVASRELATEVAARQLHAVVALLVARGLHPIILGDRWYACAPFLARMTDVEASELLRVKSNRVFYHPAPARLSGQIGASRKDGDRFQCKDERAAMENRMPPGKAPMPKERKSRGAVGTTCTCAPPAGSRSRLSRSSVMEPARRLVIPRSAGLSGKASRQLLWPRSVRRIGCATRMSMAIVSTSRNCSGTFHG